MDDRINWFQGWVIILMIFVGISMLVHYENRGIDIAEEYQREALRELKANNEELLFIKKNQLILMEDISGVCATQQSLGLANTWAASVEP